MNLARAIRDVRDRDIFQDEDGRIFVTLGYIQPPDRIISFLKYVTSNTGRWKSRGANYDRVFWGGVDSVVDGENLIPPDYIHHDPHFGVDLMSPPHEAIVRYFTPEERMREIRMEGPKDILEERALYLAQAMHDQLGISFFSIGVAGSILWKGHNPSFSDINMNVYGIECVKRWSENQSTLWNADPKLTVRSLGDWEHAISRIKSRVPALSDRDLELMFTRRHAICVDKQCIGVTPVLYPEEAPIQYGTERYVTHGEEPVRISTTITESPFSSFHPAIYDLEPATPRSLTGIKVERLMVYDGAFGGLFHANDRIEASGMLQEIFRNDESCGYQLMIGTKKGAGREFIRIQT